MALSVHIGSPPSLIQLPQDAGRVMRSTTEKNTVVAIEDEAVLVKAENLLEVTPAELFTISRACEMKNCRDVSFLCVPGVLSTFEVVGNTSQVEPFLRIRTHGDSDTDDVNRLWQIRFDTIEMLLRYPHAFDGLSTKNAKVLRSLLDSIVENGEMSRIEVSTKTAGMRAAKDCKRGLKTAAQSVAAATDKKRKQTELAKVLGKRLCVTVLEGDDRVAIKIDGLTDAIAHGDLIIARLEDTN
jgi:hypothetical protein